MGREYKGPFLGRRGDVFYIRYHDGKRNRQISTQTTVLLEAQQVFTHWLEGGGEERPAAVKDPVLMDVVRDWYEENVYMIQPSWQRTHSIMKNLDGVFGDMRISQVNGEGQKGCMASRQPAASGTVRLELGKLRTSLKWASERREPREERLRREDLPYIIMPAHSQPRNIVVQRQLLTQMRDAAIDMAAGLDKEFGLYLILLIETAQRKSAVLDLRWQQVNFERRQIQFNPEGREQTRKRRPVLPMSNTLERVLLPHRGEPDQLVCGFKRDPYEKFKQWAFDMGMPELSAHVFRHTWASHSAEDGLDMKIIAAFLGDTMKTVEENYMHLSPDYLRQAVDR